MRHHFVHVFAVLLLALPCQAAAVLAQAQGAQARGDAVRPGTERAPQVGELAPLFELKSVEDQSAYKLADARGQRPVVLIFGSYT